MPRQSWGDVERAATSLTFETENRRRHVPFDENSVENCIKAVVISGRMQRKTENIATIVFPGYTL